MNSERDSELGTVSYLERDEIYGIDWEVRTMRYSLSWKLSFRYLVSPSHASHVLCTSFPFPRVEVEFNLQS